MRQELAAALVRDFPTLYVDYGGDPRTTSMSWGFQCGDGWESVIRRLSERLAITDPEAKATCVKEKFGTLHFYVTGSTEAGAEAIRQAELESANTCEQCGAPGKARKQCGWISTQCGSCLLGVE
jgi:hypothetical protein